MEDYASGRSLAVYRPTATPPTDGDLRRPVVVLVHGCCGDRSDLNRLAEALVAAGSVVLNADWAGMDADARFPGAYADVACAVRFANAHAASLGGGARPVVLAGWSDGALAAAVVGAVGARFDSARCRYPHEEPWPDAVVGIAGFYGWPLPVPDRYVTPRGVRFFGSPPRQRPDAWRTATPYAWLTDGRMVPTTLLVGEGDLLLPDARRYAEALRSAARPVRLAVLPYGGDGTLLSPRTSEGRSVVAELLRPVPVGTAPCSIPVALTVAVPWQMPGCTQGGGVRSQLSPSWMAPGAD